MISTKSYRVFLFVLLFAFMSITAAQVTLAQDSNESQKPSANAPHVDYNFDAELYLVLASNQRSGEGQLPASLDQVVKQLRATLPFKNYSLAATLVNRLKADGGLSLTWVGGPMMAPSTSISTSPTFNELSVGQVRVVEEGGKPMVQMHRFSYGARVPIQTGTNISASGTNSAPVFAYEHLGLVSDFSVRPDQPTVVGTLNAGPSGDAIIVVLCARRAQP